MATVTLKFVNPAAAGKKFGSVVDSNNERYPVAAALVTRFEKGKTYEVTIEQQKWKDGPVNIITAIDSVRTAHAPTLAQETAQRASNGSGGVSSDRWWLPFCSNQIHALIAAGVIKDKASLNQWAKDLKEAVIATDAL